VKFYLLGEGTKTEGGFWAMMGGYIVLVMPNGKYDVKLGMEKLLNTQVIKIGSKWYEYSTAGNILFGYYSHAAGFTLQELQKGAGAVQVYDYYRHMCFANSECGAPLGTQDTFYDSSDDFSAIQFGYELFDSDAATDGIITPEEFTIALDNYSGPYPLDVRPDPGNYLPGGPYPADYFYQW